MLACAGIERDQVHAALRIGVRHVEPLLPVRAGTEELVENAPPADELADRLERPLRSAVSFRPSHYDHQKTR